MKHDVMTTPEQELRQYYADHHQPNACSSDTLQPRSLSLTPFLLKVSGIEYRTFLLLLTNFVKLNPSSLHIDLTILISLMYHQHKSFLLVHMQFQFYISSHFSLQFPSVHSCCRLQKKHLQKHEHTSRGRFALLRNHNFYTIKIIRSFDISLRHASENNIFSMSPINATESFLNLSSTPIN